MSSGSRFNRLLNVAVAVQSHEVRAVVLAFVCNFIMLASYYLLRPLRDTMSTVFGVDQLQYLYTGNFVLMLACAPIYAAATARFVLARFLPGFFAFLVANILVLYALFQIAPESRWVAGAFYWWFNVANLTLISVFWTFMADTFSHRQATRLFAFIAAGGSIGAITGPLMVRSLAPVVGISGLLLIAAAGFALVTGLVLMLVAEKRRLRAGEGDAQRTAIDHTLPGNPFRGFGLLFKSPFLAFHAVFVMLLTWLAAYLVFMQVDLITKAYTEVERRAVAFANLDLFVNIFTALILMFGLGRIVTRFGVTTGLVLTPIILAGSCIAVALSPTLLVIQVARGFQRVSQYAIFQPSREMLFTVVDQESRYKAKNVIDTVAYRFGDLSAGWIQAGLRAAGMTVGTTVALAVATCTIWGAIAAILGRKYETLRKQPH